MFFLTRVVILTFTLLLIARVVPGIEVQGFYPALIAAVCLSLVHFLVKPILIIVTLPVTILTFGLFIFFINAALFFFVASFVDGFAVSGWLSACVGSILLSVVSGFLQ